MDKYTIKSNRIELFLRHYVDSGVRHAVSEFRDELGDLDGLVSRIALAAAHTAVETFAAHCNAELRLIEARDEERYNEMLTKPLMPVFIPNKDA